MVTALILLLLTSFSAVGLVSLWAATSSRHWFVRAALLAIVFIMLAQLRTRAPLALFTFQGLAICGGVWMAGAWRRWRRGSPYLPGALKPQAGWRFSLIDALLATVIAAGIATAAKRLTEPQGDLDTVEWLAASFCGVSIGVVTLLAWRGAGSWRRSLLTLLMLSPLSVAFGYTVEYLGHGLSDLFSMLPYSSTGEELFNWRVVVWALMVLGTWGITAIGCWLGVRLAISPRSPALRWTVAGLAGLLAAFPAFAYWRLVSPSPIPTVAVPVPNGIDDIAAAGKGLYVRAIDFADELPIDQLAPELVRLDNFFQLGERGVRRPCRIPLTYTSADINTDYLKACRALARAFAARAKVALAEGRTADAARDLEYGLLLGPACSAGGVGLHYLVRDYVEDIALGGAWEARKDLLVEEQRQLIDCLQYLDEASEPIEELLARDKVFDENAFGFYGQLYEFLTDVSGENWVDSYVRKIDRHNRSCRALLACDLAICVFESEQGRLPESLAELVPTILAGAPIDPCDPHGAALRYRRDDEYEGGYLLYSVGLNGVDDGGVAIQDDDSYPRSSNGDMLLEPIYRND